MYSYIREDDRLIIIIGFRDRQYFFAVITLCNSADRFFTDIVLCTFRLDQFVCNVFVMPDSFNNFCYHLGSLFFCAFHFFQYVILKKERKVSDALVKQLQKTVRSCSSPNTIQKIFQKNKFIVQKIFSPSNTLSLQHLFWLIPLPSKIKRQLANSNNHLLNRKIKIKLGNLCLEAQKPSL